MINLAAYMILTALSAFTIGGFDFQYYCVRHESNVCQCTPELLWFSQAVS